MELLNYPLPIWATLAVGAGYFIFMSAVNALEMPKETDSASYKFWFRFLNNLAANIARARAAKKNGGNSIT